MNSALRLRQSDSKQSGFTILELLISITVMMFISLAIYQAVTSTFRLRTVLAVKGDFYNGIRAAVQIFGHDVALIFSPQAIVPKKNSSQASQPADANTIQAIIEGDQRADTDYWRNVIDQTGMRYSRFVGEEDSVTFITISHRRIYKEAPESIFAKIEYKLGDDDFASGDLAGTNVLIKKISANAFDVETDEDDRERSYPLLYGVEKLGFRYYWKRKDQWLKKMGQ